MFKWSMQAEKPNSHKTSQQCEVGVRMAAQGTVKYFTVKFPGVAGGRGSFVPVGYVGGLLHERRDDIAQLQQGAVDVLRLC